MTRSIRSSMTVATLQQMMHTGCIQGDTRPVLIVGLW